MRLVDFARVGAVSHPVVPALVSDHRWKLWRQGVWRPLREPPLAQGPAVSVLSPQPELHLIGPLAIQMMQGGRQQPRVILRVYPLL